MVVCKFFREGYCRFGSDCRFEHSYTSKYSYHAPPKPTPPPPTVASNVTTEKIVTQVADEVRAALNGRQWLLTCYAPFSRKNFPGFCDVSPEEARHAVYEAKASNTMDQAVSNFNTLMLEANEKYRKLLQPDTAITNALCSVYKQESADNPFGKSSFQLDTYSGSTNAFSGQSIAASVFGGQNQSTPQNVFGGQSSNAPAQSQSPSVFGQSSPLSVFGGQANARSPQSIFGSQNSPPSPQSVFGAPSESPTPQSVFGALNSSQIPQAVFGAHNNQQNPQSVFGVQSNPQSPQSIFGAQKSPQSVFGAQTTPPNPQSVFGAQNHPPGAQSVFGAHNNSSPQSVFGSQNKNAQSIFGMQSNSTAAQGIFSSASQQNIFAASTPQSMDQNVASKPGNVFQQNNLQSATQTQSVFGQSQSTVLNDITVYSKVEELSADDLEQFRAERFEFGFIPELPPPQELCF